jgi:hypothetical protein
LVVHDLRRVIALGVEDVGHLEHVARAVLDAQLTALAALDDEVDLADGDDDTVLVEGRAPQSHGRILLLAPRLRRGAVRAWSPYVAEVYRIQISKAKIRKEVTLSQD